MSVTKAQLEEHAKLIEAQLGIKVKTDAAAAGSWFATTLTSDQTKLEAFAKSHPGVLVAAFLGMVVGFCLGYLVGHIV